MRLLLNGRLQSSQLLQKLEREINNITDIENASPSNKISYSTLLLNNWNLNEIDEGVVDVLEKYLECQQQHTTSSLSSPIYDIVLQNCAGSDRAIQRLVAMLLHMTAQANNPSSQTNSEQRQQQKQEAMIKSSLTIRYDKQRKLPMAVAKGLLQGAKQQSSWNKIPLHALTLKGMTLTADTTSILQQAMEHLPTLQELTLRGNFTLQELDKKQPSIIGKQQSSKSNDLARKQEMECIVDLLYETLQSLPDLKVLDLQQCHLPDRYLADLLEGVYPNVIRSLNLNGNMCEEESLDMVWGILQDKECTLRELDLSWQRLPNKGDKNYSTLDLGQLSKAIGRNTSLEKLDISDNKLLDSDLDALGDALTYNTALKRLRMQNCRITTNGVLALAKHLPDWSEQLTNVYLDGQQRIEKTPDTRNAIFQALLKNVYLKELELP
ncbi:MAG: hypothetical protein SGARI_003174, partial [Bacillariaceae sp.]